MERKKQMLALAICAMLLVSMNGVVSATTDTITLFNEDFNSGVFALSTEENIAFNPDRTGYPHPTESDLGWGAATDKWEIVDGKRTYIEWQHGLGFTGGAGSYGGEPCGERQATINFGEQKTFSKVIIWHIGAGPDTPMECGLQYWAGSSWIDISFQRDINLSYQPLEGYCGVIPDTLTFEPVTGSKVRYSFDNCGDSILGTPMRHGWIFEFEVWRKLVTNNPPTVTAITLNSTFGTNTTDENLTCYADVSDSDGDNVTRIFNWYKDDSPIAVLNMPFETNSSTTAKDYSGYGNNGTVSGASWTSSGKVGGALSFSGSHYVEVPDDPSLRPSHITLEAWVYPTSYGYYRNIVEKSYHSGFTSPWTNYQLWLQDDTAQPALTVTIGGARYFVISDDAIPMNEWTHLVGTYDGETMMIYINGILKKSNTAPSGPIDERPYNLYIGHRGNHYWYGKIDEVRIYNYSLSAEQIYQHFLEGNNSLTTSTLVSQETAVGDVWMCQVTPNDGMSDGETKNSTELTVCALKPTISIYTGKTTYSPSDTMTITIDIANPTEDSVTFQWYWGVP
ncbi:MAG: LamG domain-containing protein, partial [Candidatus Eisenbacteria sp.]|nr:LamG domain-containing protein [Candidatus Eisenbacteria bacterium]